MADGDGAELGVMLYGYDRAQALEVKMFLEALTGRRVSVFGGSGLGDARVSDIIEGEEGENFGAAEPRMLMFLGFDDAGIEAVLGALPRDGNLPRPIFCAPTENNMAWTLSYLLEHLLEERKYWSEMEGRRA